MPLTRFYLDVPALADPWMQGPVEQTWLGTIGAQLDAQAETIMQGRLASNPFAGGANILRNGAARLADGRLIECDPDALPAIADQRGIRVYGTEPVLSQRVRVSRWWQLHKRRGTHRGEMEHVQPYFLGAGGLGVLPRIRIVHQDGNGDSATWHTLSGSYDTGGAGIYSVYRKTPSNHCWDAHTNYCGRWWAYLYTYGTFLDPVTHWNDGSTWGGGQTWGGIAADVLADLVSMFLDWQAAHSQCAGIALVRDLSAFDPTADPALMPDGSSTLPSAITLDVPWGALVHPTFNTPTRNPAAAWIYDIYHTNI